MNATVRPHSCMVLPTITEIDDENDGGMMMMVEPASHGGGVCTYCIPKRGAHDVAARRDSCQGGSRIDQHQCALYAPRSLVQCTVEYAGPIAWVFSMLILFHLSFCVYALVGTARSAAFYDACGGALWRYAALRVVGGGVMGVVFLYMLYTPFADLGCWRWCVCAISLAGHIASFVACVLLMREAAAHDACLAAMSAASYTNTPLLVIMCGALAAEDALRAAAIAFLLSLRNSIRLRSSL